MGLCVLYYVEYSLYSVKKVGFFYLGWNYTLKATVTLTFDGLMSKSVGIIYTPIQLSAKFEEPRSILCLLVIWARFGLYVNMLKVTVTLTFDLKINRDHLHPETHVCAKFEESQSIVCLAIIWTRFGLYQYVDGHCDLDL